MTRFARAKGSKSSNERHPEEPTPWHVMKQDMEMVNATKKENHDQKTKSAKELLNEKDDPYYTSTTGNVNTDWAEFEKPSKPKLKKEKDEHSNKKSKKKEKKKQESDASPIDEKENDRTGQQENEGSVTPSKVAIKRQSTEPIPAMGCDDNADIGTVESDIPKKKKKKDKKKKTSSPSVALEATESRSQDTSDGKTEDTNNEPTEKVEGSTSKLSKRQKRNRKNKIKSVNNGNAADETIADRSVPSTFDIDGNDWNNDIKFGDSERDDGKRETVDSDQAQVRKQEHQNATRTDEVKKLNNRFDNQSNQRKRKPPKVRDDKEHKRRKPAPDATKVMINGMEVEIVMYDGFPIRKEDAERLKDLRQQMVMKGIPKSEINAAMKLERRKAEKALSRIKKQVCFHCRKAGHNLSDCPDLSKEESATGICFKCGSTEHTHFECKVNKKAEFRFASCFICREQGHIAKQCPDNPKGLYPNGGACNICGDVTHLKKDCPDLAVAKEENTMTLSTIADNKLESLDEDQVTNSEENCTKSKKKVVTF